MRATIKEPFVNLKIASHVLRGGKSLSDSISRGSRSGSEVMAVDFEINSEAIKI
jgi:hypothetical protein